VGDTYRWMIYDDESFSSVKPRGAPRTTWLKRTIMASVPEQGVHRRDRREWFPC
jgi:hypothetical protein